MFDAVSVALPAVFNVTAKLLLPPVSAALAGRIAFASLEVMATVSLVLIKFQFASTAFTVTLKAAPVVWASGDPVLPLTVPSDAVSPGLNNCSLAKAPAFTVMSGLV